METEGKPASKEVETIAEKGEEIAELGSVVPQNVLIAGTSSATSRRCAPLVVLLDQHSKRRCRRGKPADDGQGRAELASVGLDVGCGSIGQVLTPTLETGSDSMNEQLRDAVAGKLQELELNNQRLKEEKDALERQLMRFCRRMPPPPPATLDALSWCLPVPQVGFSVSPCVEESGSSATMVTVGASPDNRVFHPADDRNRYIEDMRLSMAESNGVSSHDYSSLSDSFEDYALKFNLVDTIKISDESSSSSCVEEEVDDKDDADRFGPDMTTSIDPGDSSVFPPKVQIARKRFMHSPSRLSYPTSSASNCSDNYLLQRLNSQLKPEDSDRDKFRRSERESSVLSPQTPTELTSSFEQALISSDIAVKTHRQRQHSMRSSVDRRRGMNILHPTANGAFDNHSAPNTPQVREKQSYGASCFTENSDVIDSLYLDPVTTSLHLLNSYNSLREKAALPFSPPITEEGIVLGNGLAARLAGLTHSLSVYTCVRGKARLVQTQAAVDARPDGRESEETSSESDLTHLPRVTQQPTPTPTPGASGKTTGPDLMTESSTSMEYYSPPDDVSLSSVTQSNELGELRSTNVSLPDKRVFRNGHLSKLSGKFKMWHQYWCILTNRGLFFYSARPCESERPSRYVALSDITAVHRLGGPLPPAQQLHSSHHYSSFEVRTGNKVYTFCGESAWDTELWLKAIRKALKRAKAEQIVLRNASQLLHKGWLKRVKSGYARKVWCILLGNYLVYYRSHSELTPTGFRDLSLSHLRPIGRVLSDHNRFTSDSDSDTTETPYCNRTLALWEDSKDPVYFVSQSEMDHDKWKHYLTIASARPNVSGISLLNSVVNPTYQNQMYHCKETMTEPLSRTTDPSLRHLCISLHNCLMYISYPTGSTPREVQYEKVKFIQDISRMCFSNPGLKDEMFLQILRQSRPPLKDVKSKRPKMSLLCSSSARHINSIGNLHKLSSSSDCQIYLSMWECLCLVIPLFLPSPQVLGGLEAYLDECAKDISSETGKYAAFCADVLSRMRLKGGRQDVPSFLEVTAVSLRNPYTHVQPFSLPVHLMTGSYHVVGFDAITTVGELCQSTLAALFVDIQSSTCKLVLQHCSFSLYCKSEDSTFIFLEDSWKICDIISRFERSLIEKDPCVGLEEVSIKIYLRVRGFSAKLLLLVSPSDNIELDSSSGVQNGNKEAKDVITTVQHEIYRLLVHQVHYDVCQGYYYLAGADLLTQVALLCQAEYNNYRDLSQKDLTLGRLVSQLFPACLTTDEDSVMHLKLILLEKWSTLPATNTNQPYLDYLIRLERVCADQFCAHAFLCHSVQHAAPTQQAAKQHIKFTNESAGPSGQTGVNNKALVAIEKSNWLLLVLRFDRIVLIKTTTCMPTKRIPLRYIVSFGGQGRTFFLVYCEPADKVFRKLHFHLPDICSILELITTLTEYMNYK